ncbi:hypothetical protein N9N67_04325 [Bacteriovoracaceae bacterium]|nr:hypothetical protein [Bacteriovoracaceae bacterium]
MKGIFFQKPLEFSLEVEGEEFLQGETLKGNLNITNHGKNEASIENVFIDLKFTENKKFKAKDPTGFSLINSITSLQNQTIKSGEIISTSFEVELNHLTKVTEKSASPYITLNLTENNKDWPLGSLQLLIKPHVCLQKTIEIIERFHRFTEKGVKNKKKGVSFKLVPPNAKDMGHLVQLDLEGVIQENDDLELTFNFKTNKVNMDASTLAFKKEKSKTKLNLKYDDYLYGKNQVNQSALLKKVNEVFTSLKQDNGLFK